MHKIDFFYELDFSLKSISQYRNWICAVIASEGFKPGTISYIFCDDEYLLDLHQRYLKKDSLTDIITFDYKEGDIISGDIFISIQRIRENAVLFSSGFEEELMRVMSHGLLHLMGYKDKAEEEAKLMREKEDEKIKLFHVEH